MPVFAFFGEGEKGRVFAGEGAERHAREHCRKMGIEWHKKSSDRPSTDQTGEKPAAPPASNPAPRI